MSRLNPFFIVAAYHQRRQRRRCRPTSRNAGHEILPSINQLDAQALETKLPKSYRYLVLGASIHFLIHSSRNYHISDSFSDVSM